MGFNVNDLKQSKFLTQKDVSPAKLVTIESAEEINVAMEGAEPQLKWCLHFKELEKPLVLNSTNGQIISAIIGSGESDDWIGAKIVLYFEPNVFFGGKMTGGIRVRAMKKNQAQAIGQAVKDLSKPKARLTPEELPEYDGATDDDQTSIDPETGDKIPF